MEATVTKNFDIVTAKKSELIAKLQELGENPNPQAKNEDLRTQLQTKLASSDNKEPLPPVAPIVSGGTKVEEPKSEMGQILAAIGTLVNKVDSLDNRLGKVEGGGVPDFKADAKAADIESASASKEGVDERIVKIVENTLGVDFGVATKGHADKPGLVLDIYVPQRLSPVPMSQRPIRDAKTGEYQIVVGTEHRDPVTGKITGLVQEEDYWPGDARSVALGASDSFDVIQQHCNRVRAHILAWYQKTNRPQPQFNTR